jgi:hypothetical protein
MTVRRAAALLAAAMLAACATPEPPPPVVSAPVPRPEPPPPKEPPPRRDPLKHLANRDLKPMPVRPLNAKAKCSFRDETGYRGRMNLAVKDARVARFDARVDVPRRGSCRFDLKDFRQTGSLPAVVLTGRSSGCKISLWEQGDQVTVAFRDCRAQCSGDSVDYLWPILVDNRKGSCS